MRFQFWEQIEVTRSSIRKLWVMRNDFKSTFSRSSHGNLWRVDRGVVLQEQNTASQFSSPLSCDFPIRLHNMHCLSCNLAQDNQSWSPLDYPKRLRSEWTLLNFLGEGRQWGRRYLDMSSRVLFWSSVNIRDTHLLETFDIPKRSVRIESSVPKLRPIVLVSFAGLAFYHTYPGCARHWHFHQQWHRWSDMTVHHPQHSLSPS